MTHLFLQVFAIHGARAVTIQPPLFRCTDVTEVWGPAQQELVGQSQNRMAWAWDQRAEVQFRNHLAAPFLPPCPSDNMTTWEALVSHSGPIEETALCPSEGHSKETNSGLSRAGTLSSSPCVLTSAPHPSPYLPEHSPGPRSSQVKGKNKWANEWLPCDSHFSVWKIKSIFLKMAWSAL